MLSDISTEDQLPFAKSRLGADILSREPDNNFGLSDEDDDKETARALPRLGGPSRNDLTPRRKPPPLLSADVEAALIVAAQAGDGAAGHRLFLHHEEWARVEARKRWWRATSHRVNEERALSLDDFVAVALEAFWESVRRWKPGFMLNTFYRKAIRGALSDIAHDWRNAPGIQIDSRAQRYIRSHPDVGMLELHEKFPSLSRFELDFELNASHEIWKPTHYSEVGNADDDGEYAHDGDYKDSGETNFVGDPWGYLGGPVSEWSRQQASLHHRLREHRDWVQGKKSGSVWGDRVTSDVERRMLHRLHWMGRQGLRSMAARSAIDLRT